MATAFQTYPTAPITMRVEVIFTCNNYGKNVPKKNLFLAKKHYLLTQLILYVQHNCIFLVGDQHFDTFAFDAIQRQ